MILKQDLSYIQMVAFQRIADKIVIIEYYGMLIAYISLAMSRHFFVLDSSFGKILLDVLFHLTL
jgi:hypothetical protein